jgi:hypothetical protein
MQREDEPQHFHFLKLYGRVSKTAASRFNASRRLRLHNSASLWTISLFSLGLIIVSLLQALAFSLPFSDKAVNLGQVTLSMTVLLISVILTMNNYGVRAEKFHACGLEMSELALKLERVEREDGTVEDYNAFAEAYSEILKRFDNHENVDFMLMKLQKPQHYELPWWYRVVAYGRFSAQFVPYAFLLCLEAVWIYALLSRISFAAA